MCSPEIDWKKKEKRRLEKKERKSRSGRISSGIFILVLILVFVLLETNTINSESFLSQLSGIRPMIAIGIFIVIIVGLIFMAKNDKTRNKIKELKE